MKRTIVVMAGGTGGDVFPALAGGKALHASGYNIQWVGGERGIEQRWVPAAGYPLKALTVKGLRGGGLLHKALAPFMVLRAVNHARAWLKTVQPSVVIGFGGYASGPGGLAARLRGTPLVIHEQNAAPVVTHRVLRRLATNTVAVFEVVFGTDVEVVGNPVREAILALASPAERYGQRSLPLRILVLGGSQGALALNKTLPGALAP